MAEYVQLEGVHTWFDEQGSGEPLVMLHPGGVGVDSRAFEPNRDALAERFHIFLPERRGHGRTPDVNGPYSYEIAAEDTINFLERVVDGPARLLGVSDGAVISLLVASFRPDLVQRLICVAGVYHKGGWVPGVIEPSLEPPEFLINSYAAISPDGRKHYPVVHKKLDDMHVRGPELKPVDVRNVSCRTLLMVGDDDQVTLEHAIDFYRCLPDGELAVIPGTSHGLLVEKPDLCNRIMLDFLALDAVPTLAPIRREG